MTEELKDAVADIFGFIEHHEFDKARHKKLFDSLMLLEKAAQRVHTLERGLEVAMRSINAYLLRCDFHDGRVLSKPMPTDSEINSMRKALSEIGEILKGEG